MVGPGFVYRLRMFRYARLHPASATLFLFLSLSLSRTRIHIHTSRAHVRTRAFRTFGDRVHVCITYTMRANERRKSSNVVLFRRAARLAADARSAVVYKLRLLGLSNR